jgi:Tfp pilus assembly protein PilF
LASLLYTAARFSEAEPLLRRALAIAEAAHGPYDPSVAPVLNNLAAILQKTGSLSEAEHLLRRALAIAEAVSGPDHPNVATALNNLGQVLQATLRSLDAEPLLRRSVEILMDVSEHNGRRHPLLLQSLANYCEILVAMGKTHEEIASAQAGWRWQCTLRP